MPNAPGGENLENDLKLLKVFLDLGFASVFLALLELYKGGGLWDFKAHYGDEFRAYGNFHFGFMMAALGLSLNEAYYYAGLAEYYDGDKRNPRDGSPSGGFPYGESYDTLYWVRMGWWYYWLIYLPNRTPCYFDPRRQPKLPSPNITGPRRI